MSGPWSEQLKGKYEIVGKLGEGGMGTVFKVRHRLLDEMRVVKTMRSSLATDEELQSRFLREARLASRLRHPNIAELYDFTIAEDGTALIVMEYIPGIGIDRLLEALGPLDPGVTLELAIQSLAAIGYLHRRKYIHRDVSPDNLMLTQDLDGVAKIKLIDLGIAKVLGEGVGLTMTGMFVGKLRYSSPEQLDDSRTDKLDGRSDLYSFGVVLYELLTGRLPFEATSPSAIMAGHLFRPPIPFRISDPNGRVPPGLRKAILRALSKDREKRFRNATEFASELRALLLRYPANPDELARVMATAGAQPGTPETQPGATSAQARLDREFTTEPTPPPQPDMERLTRYIPKNQASNPSASEVAVLVAGARKFFELGQNTTAGEQLEAILALSPDHAEARELQELIHFEELRPRIIDSLSSQDFAAAEALLEEAQEHALTEAFQNLSIELIKAKDQRATELFAEAEVALDGQRAESAAELAAEGLALASDPASHQMLLDAIDQALTRSRLIDELFPALEAALQAAQAVAARELFDRIETELGEDLLTTDTRQRLEQLEREQQARGLAGQATAAINQKLLDQAFSLLEEAATLVPEDLELARRRDEVRRELELQRELESLSRLVGGLLQNGEYAKALAYLDEAESRVGFQTLLAGLRNQAKSLETHFEAAKGALAARDLSVAEENLAQLRKVEGGAVLAASLEIRRQQLAEQLNQVHEAVATVEAKLDAGLVVDARRSLARLQALEPGADAKTLRKLAAAVDELSRAHELKVERLAEVATETLSSDLEAAESALQELACLEPSHPKLETLRSKFNERQQEIAAARARTQRLARLRAEIQQLLARGDLEEAQASLARAGKLAESPELETIRTRLVELRKEALRRQVDFEIQESRALVRAGRWTEAHAHLDRAAELARDDSVASQTVTNAREAIERHERAMMAEDRVEALIASGDLDAARAELEATEELRATAIGERLRDRLAKLEQLARVRELLAEGERFLADSSFAEAETRFATAAELALEDDHIRERLAFVRRQRAHEEAQLVLIEKINHALDTGRLDDAGRLLDSAESVDSGGLKSLRREFGSSSQAVEALEQALADERIEEAQKSLEQLRLQRAGSALASSYQVRLAALCEDSFARLVKELKSALAGNDLRTADTVLVAIKSHPLGERPPVPQLILEVDRLHQRREVAVESARKRIGEHLEAGQLTAAGVWIAQLSEIAPHDPNLATLQADLGQRLQHRDGARRRADALAEVGRQVEIALGTRGATEARDLLDQAEANWGKDDLLESLHDRLIQLEQTAQTAVKSRKTAHLPESAASSRPAGTSAWAKQEIPDGSSLPQALGKVSATLEARDAPRTRELIGRAEAIWGKGKALDAAWERLARLEQEQ